MLPYRLLPLLVALASTLQAQVTPKALQSVGLDLVLIPKGSFTQGSPADETGRESDESQRNVTITQDFYMSVQPISRGAWQRFAKAANFRTESEKGISGGFGIANGKLTQGKQFTWRNPGFAQTDDDPVVMVTWDDAQAYCRWLSTQLHRRCTLPTEAQWEYACRAGTTTARYAEPVDEVAWHRGNSNGITHPLGGNKPNAWGLYDMYGPVWQWCEDWYAPYEGSEAIDPLQRNQNLSDKPRRVLRGGSFISDAAHSRSAERYRNDAKSRNADNGFRVVSDVQLRVEAAPVPAAISRPSIQKPATLAPPPQQRPSNVILQNQFNTNSSSHSSGLLGWILGLGFCAVPLIIVFLIIKAIAKRTGSRFQVNSPSFPSAKAPRDFSNLQGSAAHPVSTSRLTSNIGNDGFWINGPASSVGHMIAYSYIVDGMTHHDQVMFNPGPQGHFIFTGNRPQTVSMQSSGGVIGDTLLSSSPSFQDDNQWQSHRRSSPSFPRAY